MMKRVLSLLIGSILLFSAAWAEETALPAIVDSGLDLLQSSVHYPQITGMTDESLQQSINDLIIQSGEIRERLDRLPLIMQSPVPLTVTYDATLEGDVLSCVLESTGSVYGERATHVWNAVNIDLQTGAAITLSDLFTDPDAALSAIADMLEYDLAPELSAHLRNSALTPVPDQFALSATGLTFYYPIDQLSTLSDRAGAVTFLWTELRDFLLLEDGSILDRIGAKAMLTASAPAIRTALEVGSIPGIPLTLGASVQEATDAFHLLTDPDLYQDGRMFALEGAAFRQVWLLTDALTSTWEQSIIKGIRVDRINLYGLYTGMTREEAASILGPADASVILDAEAADAYRLESGTSDYYTYTGVQLRLHFDEEERLQSLIVTQAN